MRRLAQNNKQDVEMKILVKDDGYLSPAWRTGSVLSLVFYIRLVSLLFKHYITHITSVIGKLLKPTLYD